MGAKGAVLATLVLLVPATLSAQNYVIQGIERYFRVESTTTAGKRGPIVSGYIYNSHGHTADHVRLVVESLDGAGQVTGTTLVEVPGTIGPGDRLYFEAAVPRAAANATYRVRVASFDPIGRGP